jgi:predicted hotdog family 3-hydroxylacyl-ACP dehydratase
MPPCHYSIAELLPHRPPMLLLDAVESVGDDSLVATVTISPESLFAEQDGVPAHIGLEYMAQACGALAGWLALEAGEPVGIGFLMGTRSMSIHRAWFAIGERLTISAVLVYRDELTAAMGARIEIGGDLVAEAQLTVYQPPQSAA